MALKQVGVQLTADGAAAFNRALADGDASIARFGASATKAGGQVSGFGQVVTGALRQVGAIAVNALADAGRAFIGFVGDSISKAGDFESSMNTFAAVTGSALTDSGKSLKDFSDLFIQMGRELPVSTADVQQAAIELAKGGIDPATIAAGALRTSLNLAAAGGLGLADSATIMAKQLGVWVDASASATEKSAFLAQTANLLSQAANVTTSDVADMALGLANVGGVAKLTGLDFQSTVQTMALIAPSFSGASDAGTSFKAFLQRLQPTTKPAVKAMRNLGLYTDAAGSAFYDARGQFVGMEKVSGLLKAATTGLTDSQKTLALQTIFGSDAIRVAALLSEKGAAGYAEMGKQLEGAGSVTEQAAARQKGFNTALENAKGSVEALQLTLGAALIPMLADLLNTYIAPGINQITTFADGILSAANPMAALGAAIDTVVPGFTTFASGVAAVATFVGNNLTPVLISLGAILAAAVVPSIVAAATAFGAAVVAGAPIVAVLAAVGVAAYALYTAWNTNFGGIRDIVTSVWNTIQPIFTSFGTVIDTVVTLAGKVATAFGEGGLGAAFTALTTGLPTVSTAISTWVAGVGPILLGLADKFIAWIPTAIANIQAALPGIWDTVSTWIGEQAGKILTQVSTWGTEFVTWVPTAIADVKEALPGIWDTVSTWIVDTATSIVTKLGEWATAFSAWIGPAIPGFIESVGAFAVGIGTSIVNGVPVIVEKVKLWAAALVDWITEVAVPALQPAFDVLMEALKRGGERAKTVVSEAGNKAGIALTDGLKLGWANAPVETNKAMLNISAEIDKARPAMMVAARVIGSDLIDSLVKSMNESAGIKLPSVQTVLIGIFLGWGPSLGIAAAKLGLDFAESLFTGARDQFLKMAPGLNALGHSIAVFIYDGLNTGASLIGEAARKIGEAIITGMGKGLGDIASWVAGKVINGLNSAIGLVRANQGIHSPSTVWADKVGRPLAQGIGAGFDEGWSVVDPHIIGSVTETLAVLHGFVKKANVLGVGTGATSGTPDGKGFWQPVVDDTKRAWDQIHGTVDEQIGATRTSATAGANQLGADASNAWVNLGASTKRQFGQIHADIDEQITAAKTGATDAANKLGADASQAWVNLGNNTRRSWDQIHTDVKERITTTQTDVAQKTGVMQTTTAKTFGQVQADAKQHWDATKTNITTPVAAAKDVVTTDSKQMQLGMVITLPIQSQIFQTYRHVTDTMIAQIERVITQVDNLTDAWSRLAHTSGPSMPSTPVDNGYGKQPVPKALGGPMTAGQPYLVGEHRPEVVMPTVDSYAFPSVSAYNQRISPPASAQQIAHNAVYNTTNQGPTFNLTAQYRMQSERSLIQDINLMQLLYPSV